jgi:hypothetical protein
MLEALYGTWYRTPISDNGQCPQYYYTVTQTLAQTFRQSQNVCILALPFSYHTFLPVSALSSFHVFHIISTNILGTAKCYVSVNRGFFKIKFSYFVLFSQENLSSVSRSNTWKMITLYKRQTYTFNAQWWLYVTSALKISNILFCIYVFRTILTVNSDYFLKQR